MRTLIVALAALFSGCSMIHLHVDGWQSIEPTVVRVPDGDLYRRCFPAISLVNHILMFPAMPLGCTFVDLDKNTCLVIVGETTTNQTLNHELEHCAGMYHPGDGWQEWFDNWKAQREEKK